MLCRMSRNSPRFYRDAADQAPIVSAERATEIQPQKPQSLEGRDGTCRKVELGQILDDPAHPQALLPSRSPQVDDVHLRHRRVTAK